MDPNEDADDALLSIFVSVLCDACTLDQLVCAEQ
jgi:hypothetical protein